jgi:hypothetical protein
VETFKCKRQRKHFEPLTLWREGQITTGKEDALLIAVNISEYFLKEICTVRPTVVEIKTIIVLFDYDNLIPNATG